LDDLGLKEKTEFKSILKKQLWECGLISFGVR